MALFDKNAERVRGNERKIYYLYEKYRKFYNSSQMQKAREVKEEIAAKYGVDAEINYHHLLARKRKRNPRGFVLVKPLKKLRYGQK